MDSEDKANMLASLTICEGRLAALLGPTSKEWPLWRRHCFSLAESEQFCQFTAGRRSAMAIPEAQLDTWSSPGATTSSAAAYASIKGALSGPKSRILSLKTDIYLQGSYRNCTNIYGDSDVDVVVQLDSVFQRDLSALDATQRAYEDSSYEDATYSWFNFRADVLQTLQDYYGNARVKPATRCIKVNTGPGRITADVVPALQFRKYSYFYRPSLESHIEGVRFYDSSLNPILNFPKQHIANGEAKNTTLRTYGWYKPAVRMFKNARNRLEYDNLIRKDSCPSYGVECLVYNATDLCFGKNYQDTYAKVVDYLWTLPFDKFICQNEIIPLFGTSPVQWNTDAATEFLIGLRNLWFNWK